MLKFNSRNCTSPELKRREITFFLLEKTHVVVLRRSHNSDSCTDRFVLWVVDSSEPKETQFQWYLPGGANVPDDTLL